MNLGSYSKSIILSFIIISLNTIWSQSENPSSSSSESSNTNTKQSSPVSNLPELKYEKGDVTIDLKLEAERLKKAFDYELGKNKIHIKNSSNKELLKEFNDIRIESENLYINGNYKESRRSYKKGFQLLKIFYKDQSNIYKEKFKEYNQILNQSKDKLLETDTENKKYRMETASKKQKEAMLYNYLAKNHEDAERYNHSSDMFKLATKELLESLILIEKEISKDPENKTKTEINTDTKYLDLDYLSPIARKDWDDIIGVDHSKQENKREQDRKRIEEYSSSKLKSDSKQASPEPKDEVESSPTLENSQQ